MQTQIKDIHCNQIVELFDVLSNAIRKIGHDTLKRRITTLVENADNPLRKELELKILKLISEEYNVPIEEIVDGNKRGDFFCAKKMAFLLFKNELLLSEYKIAKYFKRTPPVVNKAIHEFKTLNINVKSDKRTIDILERINNKVSEFKKETNYESETDNI